MCRSKREEEKATEERRKTVVVGDMKPLGDALPQLPSLPELVFALSFIMYSSIVKDVHI